MPPGLLFPFPWLLPPSLSLAELYPHSSLLLQDQDQALLKADLSKTKLPRLLPFSSSES